MLIVGLQGWNASINVPFRVHLLAFKPVDWVWQPAKQLD